MTPAARVAHCFGCMAPLLRSVSHVAACLVSALGAIALASVPWSLGIVIGASIAIVARAQTELFLRRRTARVGG